MIGETFAVEPSDAPHALRLCLSYEPIRDRVVRGLEIVGELIGETTDPGVLIV